MLGQFAQVYLLLGLVAVPAPLLSDLVRDIALMVA